MSHIAVTFNYNTIRLYINGIEVQNGELPWSTYGRFIKNLVYNTLG